MKFINKDFMLHSETAKKLFHEYAENLPIIDYHCHLSPKQIAENYQFKNAYDLFLGGDHYKWRQMRSNGIEERYITGDADDYDKFRMFAKTLPLLIGNPLYHWTHLELARYFGIEETLNENTCKQIWDKCNEMLEREDFKAQALIKRSNVEVICTTDDPADDLKYHKALKDFGTKVLPTFRPDKCVEIGKEPFMDYIKATGVSTFDELLEWLTSRIEYFAQAGCKLSDHGVEYVPFAMGDASAVFGKKMKGEGLTVNEEDIYKTAVIRHCAKEYARRGWTLQIHMGAIRNNNSQMYKKLGPDTGFDSIHDYPVAASLSKLLDSLEAEDMLPKTILYSLNPKDTYVLATMLGNFQKAPTAAKIQLGSGWWFNDQRDGMEAQMKALANLGILGNFIGMLTDSRSFVSYPRHEYFRRIMCNLIGSWVENGEYPEDYDALKTIVEGISYKNAKKYFNF
ncbi:MAG: glucuronate isomerase [Clostridia bacterium]|nr:glucuronate isomerase [Clostridia bacterium]